MGERDGRKEGKERAGRKRGKSGSFVGIRSTRHGRLIKGLFQSLTESSREGEMIKTQTIPSTLPRSHPSPPVTPFSPSLHPRPSLSLSNCLPRLVLLAADRLLRHPPFDRHSPSVPSAILINVILQPQSRYLQFVSWKVAKSRRPFLLLYILLSLSLSPLHFFSAQESSYFHSRSVPFRHERLQFQFNFENVRLLDSFFFFFFFFWNWLSKVLPIGRIKIARKRWEARYYVVLSC